MQCRSRLRFRTATAQPLRFILGGVLAAFLFGGAVVHAQAKKGLPKETPLDKLKAEDILRTLKFIVSRMDFWNY